MADLPYMPLDIAKYLADTMHLNTAQHGAYMLLIMNYWQRGKALQNSDQRLAAIARMSPDAWEENKATLAEFFDVTEDGWLHRTIEADLSRVTIKVEARRAAGFASGEARRNKRSTDVEQTSNEAGTNAEQLKEKKVEEKKERPKKPPVAAASAFVIPVWVSDEAWNRFEEMRKRKGNALTDGARHLVVKKLEALHRIGHPPDEVLDQSTMNGWQGVFELKGNRDGRVSQNQQNGNRVSPAVQRGVESRDSIDAAVARAIHRATGAVDERSPGRQTQSAAPAGNVGHVLGGMAGDGRNDGDGRVPPRTIEGYPGD